MMAADDVVDLEGNVRAGLWEAALFAASACSTPHLSL
jgi:hypothetical protein